MTPFDPVRVPRVEAFLPAGIAGEKRARALLLIWIAASVLVWGPAYSLVYYLAGSSLAAVVNLVMSGCILCVPLLVRRGAMARGADLLTGCFALAVTVCSLESGGIYSPATAWLAIVPLVTHAVQPDVRTTVRWTGLALFVFGVFVSLELFGVAPAPAIPPGTLLLQVAALGGVISAGLVFVGIYDAARRRTIAHVRRTVDELAAARDEARSAEQRMARFLADMTHELRTPLNGVVGMGELLAGTDLQGDQSEYVEAIRTSSRALMGVVNHVLDLSKLEAGRLPLDIAEFDPGQLLGSVCSVLATRASDRGLELVSFVAPDVPAMLAGDEARLRQVLLNLGSNALKFTDEGSVSMSIVPDGEREGAVRFIVADTGLGITESERARLFSPFEQTSSAQGRGGTGLGLAISRKIVAQLDGELRVDSAPGLGSTFWFSLELAPGPPAEPAPLLGLTARVECSGLSRLALSTGLERLGARVLPPDEDAPADLIVGPPDSARPSGDPVGARIALLVDRKTPIADGVVPLVLPITPTSVASAVRSALGHGFALVRAEEPRAASAVRVLIADDTAINRQFAGRVLAGHGCEVREVRSGLEALEALRREHFDLVFMDFRMPGMSGPEAVRAFRADERSGPRTPIVGLTAVSTREEISECYGAGMDDVLIKPIRPEQLRASVERWTAAS